ncbi:MAG: carboxylating nicotinate-nucleotide diphosphorylase [bacterium]
MNLTIINAFLEDLLLPAKKDWYLQKILKGEVSLDNGLLEAFPELYEADLTSASIYQNKPAKAKLYAKQAGILSGVSLIPEIIQTLDSQIFFKPVLKDGQSVVTKQEIGFFEGNLYSLLVLERTLLNFVTHLSGVATNTSKFVQAISSTKAKVLDSRKTLPGLRTLQKKAVVDGGGMNHRMGLFDQVLLKNNHIDIFSGENKVIQAVQKVRLKWHTHYPILVECRDLNEVEQALEMEVDRIMLDNMNFDLMTKAVKKIAGKIPVEATGNVNLENILETAQTGVDFISIGGGLTMNSTRLDLSFGLMN